MKDISKQRFGSMGELHNAISALIDDTVLTPSEVFLVLEAISSDVKHLIMAKAAATRRKPDGSNMAKTGI